MKSQPNRLLVECTLIAACGATAAYLLLLLLHSQLESPGLRWFDLSVQAQVHRWASPAVTMLMRQLTLIGSIRVFVPTLILSLAILLIVGEREQGQRLVRKRQMTSLFGLGIGGALLLNASFKLWFHRARPSVPWSIGDEHTYSFPSGHSLFALVLYGLIAYRATALRRHMLRRVLVSVAVASVVLGIGMSRIYLGMHWPTDVIAGYLTGAIWLWATILIDRRSRIHSRRGLT